MARYEDVCWVEDIDLSGGPAAIECSLNHYAGYRPGTGDQITSPPGKRSIVRIMAADETPLTAAQFGDITIAGRRGGDISLPLCSPDGPGVLMLPGGGIPWTPNTVIDCLGNASGAGAEQHTVVLRCFNPEANSGFMNQPAPAGAELCIYEMPTDANTADTLDNPVDITGRTNAYTNGQVALADDAGVQVWLHAIRAIVPAGQSGIFLLPPGREHAYIYPTPALANVRWDFAAEFGSPLYCTGDRPILVGGYGTATTAIPLVLEMSVVRPGGV